jgi:hypothetical protein
MWQMVITALVSALVGAIVSALVSAPIAARLAWSAFKRQIQRNSVIQVYLDAAPAAYEAERTIALRMLCHVNKESLCPAEPDEISKAFSSLLGRIGKLHLVASPKTMEAVNDFYNALYEIHEGIVPDKMFPTPTGVTAFTPMTETDVPAQIGRFDRARMRFLSSMREDLEYEMDLLIEHNSFSVSFIRDRIKEGRAMASAGDSVGKPR